jgi:hypothetical protein
MAGHETTRTSRLAGATNRRIRQENSTVRSDAIARATALDGSKQAQSPM